MTRQRTIVGIGEALLIERPEGAAPGGLAIDVALCAQRVGAVGIPISRIGQDQLADELLAKLREQNIDISHLQSDPDLKTGRMVIRRIGDQQQSRLDAVAAFDNMQWDFDLDDVAQQADAAVFGMLAGREVQSRTVIERFLSGCITAVKLLDMTNRVDAKVVDRSAARACLQFADVAIVDEQALRSIVPSAKVDEKLRPAMESLLREGELLMAVFVGRNQTMSLHTPGQEVSSSNVKATDASGASLAVSLLHGVLAGWELNDVLRGVERVSKFVMEKPSERVPDDLLHGK